MKKKNRFQQTLGFALVLSMQLAPAALAQDDPAMAALTNDAKEQINDSVVEPSLTSPMTPPTAQITLLSSQGDSKAVAKLGYEIPEQDLTIGLRVVAPIEKGQEEVALADLDGLTSGSSATVSLTRLFWKGLRVDGVAGLEKVCSKAGIPDAATGGCTFLALKRKGERWTREAREAAQAGIPQLLSFQLTGQTDSFRYLEGEGFEERKATEEGYGATFAYGALLKGTYLGINLFSQEIYKGGTKQDVCLPIENTGALACQNVALKAPTRIDKRIAQLEARRFLSSHLALNPRVSHDFESDETSFQLVTYFLTDKERGLNGGIDFGYRDGGQNDGESIRFFIGAALDLLR